MVIDLNALNAGKNPPHEINVVIEIPKGSNIKYEIGSEAMLYNNESTGCCIRLVNKIIKYIYNNIQNQLTDGLSIRLTANMIWY
jgi:hypothetical protein